MKSLATMLFELGTQPLDIQRPILQVNQLYPLAGQFSKQPYWYVRIKFINDVDRIVTYTYETYLGTELPEFYNEPMETLCRRIIL